MGLAHEKKSYLQEKANLFEIGSHDNDKSHLCAYAQTFPNLILLQQQMPL